MSGILILAVLALVLIAALERSHRRHSTGPDTGLNGSWVADDRDVARSKLDLLALGGKAEPFSHKPVTTTSGVVSLRQARIAGHPHGRHAA